MTHSFLSPICGQNSMYVSVCVCVQAQTLLPERGCVDRGVIPWRLCVFFLQHFVGLSSQNWKQWLGNRPNAPLPSHPLLCWWVRQHVMLNGAFTFLDAWVTPARWWELRCYDFFFHLKWPHRSCLWWVFFTVVLALIVKRRWAETIILINTRPDWLTHKYTTSRWIN